MSAHLDTSTSVFTIPTMTFFACDYTVARASKVFITARYDHTKQKH